MKKEYDFSKGKRGAIDPFPRMPIVDQCKPCVLHKDNYCKVYPYPDKKWRNDSCPMMAKSRFMREANK